MKTILIYLLWLPTVVAFIISSTLYNLLAKLHIHFYGDEPPLWKFRHVIMTRMMGNELVLVTPESEYLKEAELMNENMNKPKGILQ